MRECPICGLMNYCDEEDHLPKGGHMEANETTNEAPPETPAETTETTPETPASEEQPTT